MMDFKYSANVSATAPKYVSTNKVADHFQVNVSTVRQWVSRGLIPDDTYIKIGETYRFRLDDVEAAFEAQTKETSGSEPDY